MTALDVATDVHTLITEPCVICTATTVLTITAQEKEALASGVAVQIALPNRDADFRELVLTGTHGTCWDNVFEDPYMDGADF